MQTRPVIVLTGATDGLGESLLATAPAWIVNVASRASSRAGARSSGGARLFGANYGRPPSNSGATCDTSFGK